MLHSPIATPPSWILFIGLFAFSVVDGHCIKPLAGNQAADTRCFSMFIGITQKKQAIYLL